MFYAKNCEKLSKFIEVTAKILSVLFFRTRCSSSSSVSSQEREISRKLKLIKNTAGQQTCRITAEKDIAVCRQSVAGSTCRCLNCNDGETRCDSSQFCSVICDDILT